ncbi:MAG: A circularly permuted ATPgrasp family protein [Betaproteobacteria bacterium]|nr:A circularly permuted ATPgrasp family protein [Betaproteobacteria bacterium]
MNAATATAYSQFFALGPQTEQSRRQRHEELNRQIQDHGLSYNIYSPDSQSQRPWSLELFPLLLNGRDWQGISQGVCQRAALLEHIAADVYGDGQLLDQGLLPSALVYGHPGFIPAVQSPAIGGQGPREYLQVIAFDLARQPDETWVVLSQRTQAPSGLGYALTNRLLVSRQHADAFQALKVRPWAQVLRQFVEGLGRLNPESGPSHIALLSPGPFNETYFEQVYLARQFGLTLVEGHDLVVRNGQVFLKALKGLERVHVIVKRMDDAFLDPLTLRADSTLGTPGLLNAYLAGQVAIVNAPGLAFLESPALLGFLPGLSEAVLGGPLALASADTWWCGEAAARKAVSDEFDRCVIKPSYPDAPGRESFETVLLPSLSQDEQAAWRGRIAEDPEAYAVQSIVALDQMPVWREGLVNQPYLLRVFALRIGPGPDQWQVIPGGMARVVGRHQIASMQQGGSSADVWLIDNETPLADQAAGPNLYSPPPIVHRGVTSRAAENLFWMGRYTERSENSLRLVQVRLDTLLTETPSPSALESWLSHLWLRLGPRALQPVSALEDLITSLGDSAAPQSLAYQLAHLRRSASAVRDRLSQEHWHAVEDCLASLGSAFKPSEQPSAVTALKALERTSRALASMTGAQSDRMLRDDGWQLLMIGRLLERLGFLADVLATATQARVLPQPEETVYRGSAVGLVLTRLFETNPSDLAPLPSHTPRRRLMDLFLSHDQSPRSLTWVALSLRKRLSKLAQTPMGEPDALAQTIDIPPSGVLQHISENDERLSCWLQEIQQAAWQLSDRITQQYFVHVYDRDTSLGG